MVFYGIRITHLPPITSGYDGQGSPLLYLLNEVICRCVPRDEIPCPTASRQPDFVVQAGRLGTCGLRIIRLLPITSGYDGQGSTLLYLLNEVIRRCVPRTGLEPATYGLEVRCSIQLSYGAGLLVFLFHQRRSICAGLYHDGSNDQLSPATSTRIMYYLNLP